MSTSAPIIARVEATLARLRARIEEAKGAVLAYEQDQTVPDRSFKHYEGGFEKLMEEMTARVDELVLFLGGIFDKTEETPSDKAFAVADDDATESDYEPSEDEDGEDIDTTEEFSSDSEEEGQAVEVEDDETISGW